MLTGKNELLELPQICGSNQDGNYIITEWNKNSNVKDCLTVLMITKKTYTLRNKGNI